MASFDNLSYFVDHLLIFIKTSIYIYDKLRKGEERSPLRGDGVRKTREKAFAAFLEMWIGTASWL
jgi:hypothetical protein